MSMDLHSWVRRYRSTSLKGERAVLADEFHDWLTGGDELTVGDAELILETMNGRGMVTLRRCE